jgi:hypothetical protein
MNTDEPARRKYDRAYRERHKEKLQAQDRERKRLDRERLKEYERKYGK